MYKYPHTELCDCRINGNCRATISPYCPKGEIFINGGAPCAQTCADLGKPCGVAQALPPIGCYCPEGQARSSNGGCIFVDSQLCKNEYDHCTDMNYNTFIGAMCSATAAAADPAL